MDYSNMPIEQLLELLKAQSPDMYSALANPIDDPGNWSDGEMPLGDYFSYDKALRTLLDRGFDPNLIVDEALSRPNLTDSSDQLRILAELGTLNDEVYDVPPSDQSLLFSAGKILDPEYTSNAINALSPEGLQNLWDENKKRPAMASAFAMLKNNKNIGK